MYGDSLISYWSERGDVVSKYILAMSGLENIDPIYLNGIQGFSFSRRDISLLRDVSSGGWCSLEADKRLSQEGAVFLGCAHGLPEAQYALAVCFSRKELGCGLNRNLSVRYCEASAAGGYVPARNGCGEELKSRNRGG
jgi:hypothetical protein